MLLPSLRLASATSTAASPLQALRPAGLALQTGNLNALKHDAFTPNARFGVKKQVVGQPEGEGPSDEDLAAIEAEFGGTPVLPKAQDWRQLLEELPDLDETEGFGVFDGTKAQAKKAYKASQAEE